MANDSDPEVAAVPGDSAVDTAAMPSGCTNLKLKQASRGVASHFEVYVGPTGLKATQYSLLSHVVKLGPIGAGELASAMRLDPSTLSRNLQPLIDKGWVQTRVGIDDARSRIIEATASGLALRATAQRAWKRGQQALNQRLGAGRVAALHALLDECMSLLDDTKGL